MIPLDLSGHPVEFSVPTLDLGTPVVTSLGPAERRLLVVHSGLLMADRRVTVPLRS